jgi:hypothetical protein
MSTGFGKRKNFESGSGIGHCMGAVLKDQCGGKHEQQTDRLLHEVQDEFCSAMMQLTNREICIGLGLTLR